MHKPAREQGRYTQLDYYALAHARAYATGLDNVPIPSTVTSQTSPGLSFDTPDGVPVAITSPAFNVIWREMYLIRKSTGKTICDVRPSCLNWPFTSHVTRRSLTSSSVSIIGPIGQNVSNDFPRVNCTPFLWTSRPVTSFRHD